LLVAEVALEQEMAAVVEAQVAFLLGFSQ